MPDREKIINGLREMSCRATWEDIDRIRNKFQPIINGAIDLLKEQEAVPVIQREVMHMLVWCCGSCGVAITDGDKFCRNCGRKMKWDDF